MIRSAIARPMTLNERLARSYAYIRSGRDVEPPAAQDQRPGSDLLADNRVRH